MVEEVPEGDYELPLGVARVAREGGDITLVGWGQQVGVLERAVRPHVTPALPVKRVAQVPAGGRAARKQK